MASLWDTLVNHVKENLPTRHGVNSAGEAILRMPFDAAGFMADLLVDPVADIPSHIREATDLVKGDAKGAAKELVQREQSHGRATKALKKVHDAIHQDTADAVTPNEKYVDAAIEAGPSGLASEVADQNLPDAWWKPAAVQAAGLAGMAVPSVVHEYVKGKMVEHSLPPELRDGSLYAPSIKPEDLPVIHPEDLKEVHLTRDEQPPVEAQAKANEAFAMPEEIDPKELSLVQDEQPPVEAQAQANEALAPTAEVIPLHPLQRDAGSRLPSDYVPSDHGLPPEVIENAHQFSPEHMQEMAARAKAGEPINYETEVLRAEAEEDADPFYRNRSLPDVVHPESDPVVNQQIVDGIPDRKYVNNIADQGAPAPANDPNGLAALKGHVMRLLQDERGGYRYDDDNPVVQLAKKLGLIKKSVDEVAPEDLPYPESFYKLSEALRKGIPARNKQEALYTEELSKRAAKMNEVRHVSGGVEGFHAEKGTLKGALPKVEDYEKMSGLEQPDIQELFDHIKNHPSLGWFQSINAREGLAKILQGEVPTRSEIALLAKTMPPELIRDIMKNRDFWDKLKGATVSTLNIPKALMASYDVSAPFRQGVFMVGRKEFYSSLIPMARSFASPKYAKAVKEAIYEDPLYPTMQESGLAIPKYDETGPMELGDHEEPFMTDYAGKIPLVGIGVRASERAYNTFVYKLRADTFKTLYNSGKAAGKSWNKNAVKDLSRFINTFTGRGDLGRFTNMAPALNTLLFSPRLLKSRLDAINPVFYHSLDPFVRKEALKTLTSFAVIATTVLGLAKFAGAEVSSDISSPDGWKIKIGNTRYDILGGEQQLLRLLTNIGQYTVAKSEEIAKTGEIKTGYNEKTAIDRAGQFLRNKESPDVSFAHDFYSGKTAVGKPFNLKEAAMERGTPMSAGDAEDIAEDLQKQGVPADKAWVQAIAMALPGVGGVSISTYEQNEKKGNGKEFGNEFGNDFGKEFKGSEF